MIFLLYAYAGWMLIMNLVCFILMYSDKKRARQHRRRIPERTLLLTGLFGRALGGWLGMYAFRHKTRHPVFVVGMPLMVALYVPVTWLAVQYLH